MLLRVGCYLLTSSFQQFLFSEACLHTWGNPACKHLKNCNQQKIAVRIHKWMKNLVHYFSENNIHITANNIGLHEANTPHTSKLSCDMKTINFQEYLPEYTSISFIIIHDGIKDGKYKIGIIGSKNQSISHQYSCSWHKTPLTLKNMQYISNKLNIT